MPRIPKRMPLLLLLLGLLPGCRGGDEGEVLACGVGFSCADGFSCEDGACVSDDAGAAPDTAAPDTTAPDTAAPDTAAPDTTAPADRSSTAGVAPVGADREASGAAAPEAGS